MPKTYKRVGTIVNHNKMKTKKFLKLSALKSDEMKNTQGGKVDPIISMYSVNPDKCPYCGGIFVCKPNCPGRIKPLYSIDYPVDIM